MLNMSIEIDKCCFCIDLRKGSLIIAYFNLFGEVSLILMAIVRMLEAAVGTAKTTDEDVQIARAVVVFMGILLFISMLFLAFTIALLVGLHNLKRDFVKAYLIFTMFCMVLYIVMFIFGLLSGQGKAFNVATDLFSIIVNCYFYLVIWNYYMKMDVPAKKPAINNTA